MNTKSSKDLETLINALDLSELPVEEQEEILIDINDLVIKGAMVRIVERMDEKTRDKFSDFLDTLPNEDQIADFIEKHVPNSENVVKETIADYADDILAVTR